MTTQKLFMDDVEEKEEKGKDGDNVLLARGEDDWATLAVKTAIA